MAELQSLRGYEGLSWFMDGCALCIVCDDFVDLQESPAVFPNCPYCGSSDIIPPAAKYPQFTCNECGRDFHIKFRGLDRGDGSIGTQYDYRDTGIGAQWLW